MLRGGDRLLVLTCLTWLAASCDSFAAGSKPDLTGDWQPVAGSPATRLSIQQDASGDKIRIVEVSSNDDKKTDFECSTRGKECTGTVEGQPSRITVYYNGPTLVELAVQGKDGKRVTKTRRTLSPDTNSMTVEVIEIVPPGGKPEQVKYTRATPATAQR